ncbi:MAG: putative capsid protein [Cressdnaviricota sp.]|nr:MAG: putative capsid protein [Cressdnaviricota sp.]
MAKKTGKRLVLIPKGTKLVKRGGKKRGLTKTEKKETKSIVNAAIKKEHTLKYFNSSSTDGSAAIAPQFTTVGNNKEVSVVAFSSTTEFDNAGAAVKFGPQDYVPLHLARPFKENNADESLNAQALNGQYCLPKRATTSFSIERVAYEVGTDTDPGVVDLEMAHSLPIYYRIIKVGIKAQQGNAIVIDPNLDIMVDSFGQPYGPDSDNFNRLNMRMSPINTKKYTKIMDLTGVINQNNIITPAQSGATSRTDIVTQKNGASLKHMTIPFMLSQRKGGKLFYDQPQQAGTGPATFTSGGKRELLLMFFTFEHGHNLLGGTDQLKAPLGSDIQIKFKSTSAFVDAQ